MAADDVNAEDFFVALVAATLGYLILYQTSWYVAAFSVFLFLVIRGKITCWMSAIIKMGVALGISWLSLVYGDFLLLGLLMLFAIRLKWFCSTSKDATQANNWGQSKNPESR